MLKYSVSTIVFTVIALVLGWFIDGFSGVWIVAVLGVLELSLSFDNAVLNASILKNWGPKWRQRFITWGMPIAVFGMRLFFPLLIVAVIAKIGPIEAFQMAIKNPIQYAHLLSGAHHQISAYGGTFLLMIFLTYFMDSEKQVHWIHSLELTLKKVGKLASIQVALVLIVLLLASYTLKEDEQLKFIIAGICGLITYIFANSFGSLVGGEEKDVTNKIIKEGIMGFIYLELLDASFSFDGVMGAFALTNNILIIVLGLGIGALFVRSLTLYLVEKETLSEFRYLEHGAFWGIGALAIITFISVKYEVPEVITGFLGAGFIGLSVWSSYKRKN